MKQFVAFGTLLWLLWSSCLAQTNDDDTPPTAVFCEQEVYALCAYANCTINGDLVTASCLCYGLSGVSAARIDMIPTYDDGNDIDMTIPNNNLQLETMQVCNTSTSCQAPNGVDEAPLCTVIANQSLYPGADAISTFSRALHLENSVDNDETITWNCEGRAGRWVPNCMLAPCVRMDSYVANPYYFGLADYSCTCPLIPATVNYTQEGGLQDPCDDPVTLQAGAWAPNTGGAVLLEFVQDQEAVELAQANVARRFAEVVSSVSTITTTAPMETLDSSGGDGISVYTFSVQGMLARGNDVP